MNVDNNTMWFIVGIVGVLALLTWLGRRRDETNYGRTRRLGRIELRWEPQMWLVVGWIDGGVVLALLGLAVKVRLL